MATNWNDFRKTLNLTPEEEEIINLEKSLISAVVEARLESAIHSPQINSMIRI